MAQVSTDQALGSPAGVSSTMGNPRCKHGHLFMGKSAFVMGTIRYININHRNWQISLLNGGFHGNII